MGATPQEFEAIGAGWLEPEGKYPANGGQLGPNGTYLRGLKMGNAAVPAVLANNHQDIVIADTEVTASSILFVKLKRGSTDIADTVAVQVREQSRIAGTSFTFRVWANAAVLSTDFTIDWQHWVI